MPNTRLIEYALKCARERDEQEGQYRAGVGHHLATLLHDPRYALRESESGNSNVSICYDGAVGDASIRIEIFRAHHGMPAWAAVTVGFGQVRNMWWNQTPVAEHGIVHAASVYREPGKTPGGGSALPGYELIGLKWRVSAVGPKGRTSVAAIGDGYRQCPDIIALLLSLRETVAASEQAAGDFSSGEWERVAHRTGFGRPYRCPCCGKHGGDGTPCPQCSDEDGEHGGDL